MVRWVVGWVDGCRDGSHTTRTQGRSSCLRTHVHAHAREHARVHVHVKVHARAQACLLLLSHFALAEVLGAEWLLSSLVQVPATCSLQPAACSLHALELHRSYVSPPSIRGCGPTSSTPPGHLV